uniref:Protein ENHANCED DISEASE RESISTANCE 2 C-terminal domain-containing protein n=1 Tax=Rhizophora mucronata TaxID=61149 RepID=A0A2P2MZ29_RHIMU
MGFVVEPQAENELPEKLIGAIRVCQMEMSSAAAVDTPNATVARGIGFAKVEHHESGDDNDDDDSGD